MGLAKERASYLPENFIGRENPIQRLYFSDEQRSIVQKHLSLIHATASHLARRITPAMLVENGEPERASKLVRVMTVLEAIELEEGFSLLHVTESFARLADYHATPELYKSKKFKTIHYDQYAVDVNVIYFLRIWPDVHTLARQIRSYRLRLPRSGRLPPFTSVDPTVPLDLPPIPKETPLPKPTETHQRKFPDYPKRVPDYQTPAQVKELKKIQPKKKKKPIKSEVGWTIHMTKVMGPEAWFNEPQAFSASMDEFLSHLSAADPEKHMREWYYIFNSRSREASRRRAALFEEDIKAQWEEFKKKIGIKEWPEKKLDILQEMHLYATLFKHLGLWNTIVRNLNHETIDIIRSVMRQNPLFEFNLATEVEEYASKLAWALEQVGLVKTSKGTYRMARL